MSLSMHERMSGNEPYGFAELENFRDFGGARSRFGGRVRMGRLFRAGQLGRVSEADIAALEQLGIGVVADLRRPSERASAPSRWTGFAGRLICSDDGDRAQSPHLAFLRGGDFSDEGVEAYLSGYYREAPFEPRHLVLFTQTFAALDQEDGALLIHCSAGKDRTGLLAALIGHALGVDHADILRDYLLTNQVMMTPARIERVAASLEAVIGQAPSQAILRGVMGVRAAHLAVAFAAIETRAGGIGPYLAGLGVGPLRLRRLREKLLA